MAQGSSCLKFVPPSSGGKHAMRCTKAQHHAHACGQKYKACIASLKKLHRKLTAANI